MMSTSKDNSNRKLQPEMQAIIVAIQKWVAVNKTRVLFVGVFYALDENYDIRNDSNLTVAYGIDNALQMELARLHDVVSVEGMFRVDSDGFVNL